MENKMLKTVFIDEIDNGKEIEILKLLEEKGNYRYNYILKDLDLTVKEGQQIIFSMITRDLIRFKDKTTELELNVNIK